jgi:hypothetical protein
MILDIVAGQVDVIPAERRQPTKTLIVDSHTVPAKVNNGAVEITAVEESNACGHEIECRRAMRLPLVRARVDPRENYCRPFLSARPRSQGRSAFRPPDKLMAMLKGNA